MRREGDRLDCVAVCSDSGQRITPLGEGGDVGTKDAAVRMQAVVVVVAVVEVHDKGSSEGDRAGTGKGRSAITTRLWLPLE